MNNMLGKDVVYFAYKKYIIPSLIYVENNVHAQRLNDIFGYQLVVTSFMNVGGHQVNIY